MNRKVFVALTVVLLVWSSAAPARAQAGDPPSQGSTSVHIVQRGETLFSIARRYGLTPEAIAHANGIPDPRQIYVGQRLFIPGGQEDASATPLTPHIVQAGDTLVSIARRYHTSWQTLVQLNSLLAPNVVHAGQIIQVPAAVSIAGEEASAQLPTEGGAVYIVRPDDTLLHIALRHDVSPWMLAATSRVGNPALLYPGQELLIPGDGPGPLPAPFVAVEAQPLPVAQGSTLVVAVRTTEPVALEGGVFGQGLHFAEEEHVYYGLAGVHVFTEPGLYELELTAVDGQGERTRITTGVLVEAGRFSYERIDVPASRTGLLDPSTYARDRERFDAVRSTFTAERFWTAPFQRPCGGSISAYFGSHRSYNGGPYTSYHSGVDFRAPQGTPVHAAAGGTVVLAEPTGLWGNAIVIDHGWGVLTGYGHLSAIDVQVGQQVRQGDSIGKVGNTGLSTGSHLHWEMWVGGNSVNGLQWLETAYPWPARGLSAIGG